MAWFGDGFSSLKGQLSNLAKTVLINEEESTEIVTEVNDPVSFSTSTSNNSQAPFEWNEAEEGAFIGQGVEENQQEESPRKLASNQPQLNKDLYSDGGTIIPKGITNLFNQIGDAASQHIALARNTVKKDAESQASAEPSISEARFLQLSQHNAELLSEVESLRRMVRDLESQVATTQDENANLSTGLEELDIHHQEAIDRILAVKDEATKELDLLREQMNQREMDCRHLEEKNQTLLKKIEMLNLDIQGNETLIQENAELREKLSELIKEELPPIPEQSAAEEHVRTLEAEAVALRESRDNLERETAGLLSQLRQRDATLRQVDAKLEEITKEKEIKEREMTQIVFECNALRGELKTASDNIKSLEMEGVKLREEISLLTSKLQESLDKQMTANSELKITSQELNQMKEQNKILMSELKTLREKDNAGKFESSFVELQIEQLKKEKEEALQTIEVLNQRIIEHEKSLAESYREEKELRKQLEEEQDTFQSETNKLRDIAHEYGIKKDIFKEKEAEMKRQLLETSAQLASITDQLATTKQEVDHLSQLNSRLEQDMISLSSESKNEEKEILRLKNLISEITSEKEKLVGEVNESKILLECKTKELLELKSSLECSQNDISNCQNIISSLRAEIANLKNLLHQNEISKTSNETQTHFSEEKEREAFIINLSEEIKELNVEKSEYIYRLQEMRDQKMKLEENLKSMSEEKINMKTEKEELEKTNSVLLMELNSATRNAEQLKEELEMLKVENREFSQEQICQLKHQVDHLKNELKEIYDDRELLTSQLQLISVDKDQLLIQVNALRGELDTIPSLKQELELMKTSLKEKDVEIHLAQNEIKRLDSALSVQLKNNELIYNEKNELVQKNDQLLIQMQKNMACMDKLELTKAKEIEYLKQEVDDLKTQLEYASQLLQDVERQEGEGQPSGELNNQKTNAEQQEELSRLSATLLKEQTDKKILQNLLSEKEERLEKIETQLERLKKHLVEVEESYCSELSNAEEKLREMQVQLAAAEERARTSTSAYTSASIRSNQQVEALKEQVRLLTEHKERLDQQVSLSEDTAAKQAAAITRLQAVLHQFQIDKQKDIDFETARIRRDLTTAEERNEGLQKDLKILQEQLENAREGLATGQRLSEQLVHQSETITHLKSEIFELNEKLRKKEEKVNDLSSENKVDRQLVTNLLIGFVTSPTESKMKVLGVLGQVLSLTKEERQKIGLEPGGRQQTLSEAFIKFLQSESQPRSEVILPLASTTSLPVSRKSSILTPEVPVLLPHFPVGRNPGSILKDVLQDRRPE